MENTYVHAIGIVFWCVFRCTFIWTVDVR